MDTATAIARTILEGFDKHYRIFRETSAAAQGRFERGAWTEVIEAGQLRIDMYDRRVVEAVEAITSRFPDLGTSERHWPAIKRAYIELLYDHRQPECAETFFNSVATRLLHRTYYSNRYIFWRPAVAAEHIDAEQPTYRCYYPTETGLLPALRQILEDFGLGLPLADARSSLRHLLRAVRIWFPEPSAVQPNFQFQVLSSLFFRNKMAYLVGRMVNGPRQHPFVVALTRSPGGELRVDALIHERAHLVNLFGVAHAYFMVDMEVPSSWVSFLRGILPDKRTSELYTAVGLQKQGKTLFFRDLHAHLKHSTDRFVVAQGKRGMVMVVFTLPSFPYVFKVIRDRFAPPKAITREQVKEKYRLVKLHDRVGRLADTLEYSDVALPRDRFDPALLDELARLAPSSIEHDGDHLVIRHMYIEQRMTPLDIYLHTGDEAAVRHGIQEFGQALRDLAAANVFAGDLLPKNFGVTGEGRVVFYDFDEVCYLTECRFRRVPEPRTHEDEMSAEPWYSVGPNDVFPEEFASFLLPAGRARDLFREVHGDLMDPGYWARVQAEIRSGTVGDVFPYPAELRFA
ncbi:bifunctional isocitrate dehydrogenase kinase/phosphatase [Myxococcota bacterium]|nr:bifunctional isocitrate dehydrogenase kinase/phosphatase [Myxococcota bacterium]